MAVKMAVATIQAMLDAYETNIGTSPVLKLRTGSPPASCATADSGTVLATYNMVADFMANAAAGGTKAWNAVTAVNSTATGTIGHYRLYKSDGTTCVDQGTVGTSGADMIIDNATISSVGQPINLNSWVKDMSAYV